VTCSADSSTNTIDELHERVSAPNAVPARPAVSFASPLVLVNGPVADSTPASVPTRHARLGRNVVAESGRCRQNRCLVTVARSLGASLPGSDAGGLWSIR
jgi:hypothetical protein